MRRAGAGFDQARSTYSAFGVSRPCSQLSLSATRARVAAAAQQVLASVLVLAALVLFGAHGLAPAPRLASHTAPSLHAGSPPRAVDAVPPRLDPSLKRDQAWLDLPLAPPALSPRIARFPSAYSDAPALGPGLARPRDLRLSHFRRRIPRMNSEDPPCA